MGSLFLALNHLNIDPTVLCHSDSLRCILSLLKLLKPCTETPCILRMLSDDNIRAALNGYKEEKWKTKSHLPPRSYKKSSYFGWQVGNALEAELDRSRCRATVVTTDTSFLIKEIFMMMMIMTLKIILIRCTLKSSADRVSF